VQAKKRIVTAWSSGCWRVEDGLAKLEVATMEAPDNLTFAQNLIRKRELIVNRMLLAADNERRLAALMKAELLYERVLKLIGPIHAPKLGYQW